MHLSLQVAMETLRAHVLLLLLVCVVSNPLVSNDQSRITHGSYQKQARPSLSSNTTGGLALGTNTSHVILSRVKRQTASKFEVGIQDYLSYLCHPPTSIPPRSVNQCIERSYTCDDGTQMFTEHVCSSVSHCTDGCYPRYQRVRFGEKLVWRTYDCVCGSRVPKRSVCFSSVEQETVPS